MSVNTIDQQVLKSAIIQLFEEDKAFLHKIVSSFQLEEQATKKKLPQEMSDEEHAEFMKEISGKHGLKKEVMEELQELWNGEDRPKFDKSPLEMNDEEHAEFMQYIRQKHRGLTKENLKPLQELWKDEPPAEELVKMI